jgi:type IV pilus assembly protein PilC
MKQYKFHAIDSLGEVIIDNVEAIDDLDAKEKVSAKGFVLLKLIEKKSFANFLNKKKLLSLSQTSEFISNFSMMISTGLTIKNSLEALKDSLRDKLLISFLNQIIQNLIRGESLADSIEQSNPSISNDLVSMIRASESNGNLDLVLSGINTYLEKKNIFKQKMTNALIYPFFLFMVTIVVLNIIFTTVIPEFAITFNDAGISLPYITLILFNISYFLENNGIYLALGLILFLIGLLLLHRSNKFKLVFSIYILKIPYLNSLVINSNLNQFSRQVYINLLSGLQLDYAIKIASDSISNHKIKNDIAPIPEQLRKGNDLSEELRKISIFPSYAVSMISAGEQTSELINVFKKITDQLDLKLENSLERLNKLIEPIIIVFVGLVVSLIAFAILSPILSLNEFV